MFRVNKTSGVISLAGKLDYEIQRSYTFVVSARDPTDHTKSTCVDVTVYVLDYNDNAPVITYYPQMIRVDVVMYTMLNKHACVLKNDFKFEITFMKTTEDPRLKQ